MKHPGKTRKYAWGWRNDKDISLKPIMKKTPWGEVRLVSYSEWLSWSELRLNTLLRRRTGWDL